MSDETQPGLRPGWESWAPAWAKHVEGSYEAEREAGVPQHIEARCTVCQAEFRRACDTGAVRSWISRFAAIHAGCASDPFTK